MHNHPKLITAEHLAARAAADESMAVRVVLRNVLNHRGFTLHGRSNHRYLFKVNASVNAHCLDFPVSVWMENKAFIAHDLMDHPGRPHIVLLVVPWQSPVDPKEPKIKPLASPLPEQELTAEQKAEAILAT